MKMTTAHAGGSVTRKVARRFQTQPRYRESNRTAAVRLLLRGLFATPQCGARIQATPTDWNESEARSHSLKTTGTDSMSISYFCTNTI